MTDKHRDTHTHTRTFQLIESIGPEGRCFENASDGADKQTDGHGNSMTELAQWGRFSENKYFKWSYEVCWLIQGVRSKKIAINLRPTVLEFIK